MSRRNALQLDVCASFGLAWVAFASGAMLACGGEVLTLGVGDPSPAFGDRGQRVRNINQLSSDEFGATFTDDLLEVFFASKGPGDDADIWYAARRSRTDPFDPPALLAAASSPSEDVSPAISADGSTLWLGSDRQFGQGGMDVWRITRAEAGAEWGVIANVSALNSPADDLPRPPGQHGSVMPIVSKRGGGDRYRIFLASRSGTDADFTAIEPLDYLWTNDAGMESPSLSDDGLLLFFTCRRGALGDLYLAWRTSVLDPFRDPIELSLINTEDSDESDPFLSADQARFFFSSTRRDREHSDIYATSVDLPLRE